MPRNVFEDAKILIVDDELANVVLLERHLTKWGCTRVQGTTDSREVVSLFHDFAPDIILLDLMMPYLDGFEVMEQLEPLIPDETYLPILILTADATRQTKKRGLATGAKDFLTKPFDATELHLRVSNLLETRFLNQHLESRVRERTADLAQSQNEILQRLAHAAEYRDDDTGQHTQRVGHVAGLLARALGLPAEQIVLIEEAAPLHDVGKIAISDLILLKPGKLTDEEFTTMKTHAAIGAALLSKGRSQVVEMAERIAGSHHERWDGRGYPANWLVTTSPWKDGLWPLPMSSMP